MFSLSQTLSSAFWLAMMANATPLSPQPIEQRATPGSENQPGSLRVWTSEVYNVYPQQPELSHPPVSYLHLQTYDGLSQLEQVLVFRGIPSEAKRCYVKWHQGNHTDRVFILKTDGVEMPGYAKWRPLSGIYTAGVSYSSLRPFDHAPAGAGSEADFTFWDAPFRGEWPHDAGEVACAENLYLAMALQKTEYTTTLYFEQDKAKNGFYIQYEM